MSIPSIIASILVLGTSSVALAAPPCETQVQAPAQAAPLPPREIWHGPARREVVLARDARMNGKGFKIIQVPQGDGRFRTLTLQGDAGRTTIAKIQIVFADHEQQIVEAPKTLTKDASLTIDLAGDHPRAIQKIVVYGSESRRGLFTVDAV